jgi:hypothetical protein
MLFASAAPSVFPDAQAASDAARAANATILIFDIVILLAESSSFLNNIRI